MLNKKDIFHELNQTRQHDARGQQLDLFNSTAPQKKSEEYWFFSDLHNLFGETVFPTNQPMEKTAHERIHYPYGEKPTIQQSFDFCTGHYDCIRHAYKLDYRTFNNANDLKLSRYACWSFLRHKPDTIFAQTYFLSPVIQPYMDFNTLNRISLEYARIDMRNRIKDAEKILGKILYDKHANHKDFHNSTSPALFNGTTHAEIKENNHIPYKENESLLDYMGVHTLYARMAALYSAFRIYNRTPNQTVINLEEILSNELYNQRKEMINRTGMQPEQNISRKHINQIQKELKLNRQKFIDIYAKEKIR